MGLISKNPLDIVESLMEIRLRQHKNIRKIVAEKSVLLEKEQMAYEIIVRTMIDKSVREANISHPEATQMLDKLESRYGKKALLSLFVKDAEFLGVPYYWFVFNVIICFLFFAIYRDVKILLYLSSTLHLIGYIFWLAYEQKAYDKKIDKIISDGTYHGI